MPLYICTSSSFRHPRFPLIAPHVRISRGHGGGVLLTIVLHHSQFNQEPSNTMVRSPTLASGQRERED